MAKLDLITMMISEDEPCYYLAEYNQLSKNYRNLHRYQEIKVIRNDRIVKGMVDLGLSTKYLNPEFQIPGGVRDDVSGKIEILHTVGELRDIADSLRIHSVDYGVEIKPSNLIEKYYDHIEARRLYARRNGR